LATRTLASRLHCSYCLHAVRSVDKKQATSHTGNATAELLLFLLLQGPGPSFPATIRATAKMSSTAGADVCFVYHYLALESDHTLTNLWRLIVSLCVVHTLHSWLPRAHFSRLFAFMTRWVHWAPTPGT
jgi:hypothetical protein